MAIAKFYANGAVPPTESFCILNLGIHETMAPGIVRHGGQGFPYLFMFFHDQAWIHRHQQKEEEATFGLIIWKPEALHDYGNPDRAWDHSWMVARGDAIAHAAAKHQLPLNRLLFFKAEKLVVHYLKLIYNELRKQRCQDDCMLEGLVTLWLYELARAYRHGQAQIPDRLLAAEAFIRKNFNQPLTLPAIARVAALSVPRFMVVFKQFYGEPPVHFLIRTRLQRAAQLLEYNQLSIKEIAQEVGFADQLYFSRQFKAAYGQSPRQFRQERLTRTPEMLGPPF